MSRRGSRRNRGSGSISSNNNSHSSSTVIATITATSRVVRLDEACSRRSGVGVLWAGSGAGMMREKHRLAPVGKCRRRFGSRLSLCRCATTEAPAIGEGIDELGPAAGRCANCPLIALQVSTAWPFLSRMHYRPPRRTMCIAHRHRRCWLRCHDVPSFGVFRRQLAGRSTL